MKKLLLYLSLMFCMSNVAAQDSLLNTTWLKIDQLDKNREWEQARPLTDSLYEVFKQAHNWPLAIKALLYKQHHIAMIDKDGWQKALLTMGNEAVQMPSPAKEIALSITAEAYFNYLDLNWSYQFKDSSFVASNLKTWDRTRLLRKAQSLYEMSIQNPAIVHDDLSNYAQILKAPDDGLVPLDNVYDVLVWRAIQFFMSNEYNDLLPSTRQFDIDNTFAFASAKVFAEQAFIIQDTTYRYYKITHLFQALSKSHLEDKNPTALLEITFARLAYMYRHAYTAGKALHYEAALKRELANARQSRLYPRYAYQAAKYFYELSKGYSDQQPDKRYHTALSIAYNALDFSAKDYPSSSAITYCQDLKRIITQAKLGAKVENRVSSTQPILAHLTYRNTSKVYCRVVQITDSNYSEYETDLMAEDNYIDESDSSDIAWLLEYPSVQDFEVNLKGTADYNYHSTEIALNPVGETGGFVLLISNNKAFQVSDSLVTTAVYFRSNDNLDLVLTTKLFRDTTLKSAFAKLFDNDKSEKKLQNTLFFLDKTMYKPGDTIRFNALTMLIDTQNRNDCSGQKRTVILYQKDKDILTQKEFITNAYGSFSGEFVLPSEGKMDDIRLIDNKGGQVFILIDNVIRHEYSIALEPLQSTNNFNQKVKVRGVVKSEQLSSPNKSLNITYKVVRQVYFSAQNTKPIEFIRESYKPIYTDAKSIFRGETTSAPNGYFEFEFIPLIDDSLGLSEDVYYQYTVYIFIMRPNTSGAYLWNMEEASVSMRIGKVSLMTDIIVDSLMDCHNIKPILLRTTDLDGYSLAAKGIVQVEKLKSSKSIYEKRYWSANTANYTIIPKKDFEKHFPDLAYENEDNLDKWAVEKQVFRTSFNTKVSNKLDIPKKTRWSAGVYRLTLNTRDPNGHPIKCIKYFKLFDSKRLLVPEQTPLLVQLKQQPYQVNDTALVYVGTAFNDLTILYEIEYDGIVQERKTLNLKQLSVLKIPLDKDGLKSCEVSFVAIRNHRIYGYRLTIPVRPAEIKIHYTMPSNKLLKGQCSPWQIRVSDANDKPLDAEVLVGLYNGFNDLRSNDSWHIEASVNFKQYNRPHLSGETYLPNLFYSSQVQLNKSYFGASISQLLYPFDDWERDNSIKWGDLEELPGKYPDFDWYGFLKYDYANYNLYDNAPSIEIKDGRIIVAVPKLRGLYGRRSQACRLSGPVPYMESIDTIRYGMPPDFDKMKCKMPIYLKSFNGFFPQLRADSKEVAKFSLNQVPEGAYCLRVLAHTPDMRTAYSQQLLTIQKPLTIEGTHAIAIHKNEAFEIKGLVKNQSLQRLSGKVRLELYDASNGNLISTQFAELSLVKGFKLNSQDQKQFVWSLKLPETSSFTAISYKLTVVADTFTDTEQDIIPILTK